MSVFGTKIALCASNSFLVTGRSIGGVRFHISLLDTVKFRKDKFGEVLKTQRLLNLTLV